MNFRIASALASLMMAASAFAQNTVGTIAYDPDLYTEGYTMIYPHNQNRAMLLNACGEVVHDWTIDVDRRPGNTAYLQPNGDIIMTSRPAAVGDDAIWAGGGGATIERRSWDNDVLWSFTANNDSLRLHHDFTVTPEGNVIAICWEVIDSLECIANGRNPELLQGGELWSDKVIELEPDGNGGAEVVWEWRVWDHLVQDFDSTKANYGVVADNQQLIDVNYGTVLNQPRDWHHMNAIDYFPYYDTAGQIIMSVPTYDEVWVIWHDYQFSDDLIWRWGNPAAYQRGDSTDQKLFYQHDIHWGNGLGVNPGNPDFTKFFVFNNRVPNADTTGTHSEVAVISPIFDEYDGGYEFNPGTGRWGPEDFQWTYTQPGLSSTGLSSFQRLGNGGNLICNGRTGELFEITEGGELAWEYRTPLLQGAPVSQGTELQLNNNLTFRADRYPLDFPAFNGQDLSSGDVIEMDPTPLAACQTLACDNELACNYGESGDCVFIDTEIDVAGPMMLGLVDFTLCPDGYEVTDDGFVTLTPSMGGLDAGYEWFITPEIEALMLASGFEILLNDLNSQSVSVCGSELTAASGFFGDTTVVNYDGTGWYWPLYDGYTAPASNFETGCNDPDYCNFDPCALPDSSLCTVLELITESNTTPGTIIAQAVGGTAPYIFNVLDENQQSTGFPSTETDNPTLTLAGLPDGTWCIEVTDATDCYAITCVNLGVFSVEGLNPASFQLHPNPAAETVQLTFPDAWDIVSITLRDAAGRKVLTPGLSAAGTISLSALPEGMYLLEIQHAAGTAIERVVVRR
ncbi:MAG: aryl-sulfate sulfotransferase [Flavobacteriales bacterium]|nr:aryl-sulfate sulfotransferase [Flavobacteriales bacterium]